MAYKSWRSYWDFHKYVTTISRYVFDKTTEEFLEETLKTSGHRKISLSEGEILWRSQLGSETIEDRDEDGNYIGEYQTPFSPSRMYPRKSLAREGRANPKGISYLYTATNKETAMAESRPWIKSQISVARLKLTRDVSLIDCSRNIHKMPFFFSVKDGFYEPSDDEKENAVWTHIDQSYSSPVIDNIDEAAYVPTQILSEFFRVNGFDGVMYKSMLSSGCNVVLFDNGLTEMISCHLCETKNIEYSFEEIANPYYCRIPSKSNE